MTDAPELIAEIPARGSSSTINAADASIAPPVRKRGRHYGPRPVEDPRSDRIDLRVTPEQKAALKTLAGNARLSVAGLIILCTLGTEAPRTRRHPGPDLSLLSKMLGQMGKSGSNLNQIARRLNEYDFGDIPELLAMHAELKETLAEHRTVCDAILRAVGA